MCVVRTIWRGGLSVRVASIVGLSALLAFDAPARAEVAERELLLFDEPVVTAAAKHEQTLADAPASVSVITQEDIRRFGYRTLADALRSLDGFYGSYDRAYDYLGVRGFLIPGDYNDRILLLVNGHAYNNDLYQQAPLGNDFGIDMEDIVAIEVVRGPGSALYGGNGLFAVINVVTAAATTRPGVRLLAQGGSFDSVRGHGSVGHVFANGLEVFTGGSAYYADGQDELYYSEYDSPETNNGVARHRDREKAFNVFLNARYSDFSLQGGATWREKNLPTGAFSEIFNDPYNSTNDARYFAEVAYASQVVADIELAARLYYDGYEYKGDAAYDYGEGYERVLNRDKAVSNWFGGELRGRRQLFEGNALTVGGEYSYHPDASIRNYDRGGPTYVDVARSFNTWGVYTQDEWTLHPTLNLVAGVRYDAYYNRLSNWSPRAAAIWRPVSTTTAKLLYGQAFRAPNPYELYYGYPCDGCTARLTNPDLDPERIATYEAVLEQAIWRRIEGRIDVYHWHISDLVQQVDLTDSNGSAVQFQNTGSAHSTGMELELRVPLPHDILARATYTLQDARAGGGARLPNSPRNLGTASVLFPLPWDIEGGTELLVVGPRRTLAGSSVATATIASLTLARRDLLPHLLPGVGLSASFYNIFDQHYDDPVSSDFVQNAIEQDGFTFRVQLRYVFQP